VLDIAEAHERVQTSPSMRKVAVPLPPAFSHIRAASFFKYSVQLLAAHQCLQWILGFYLKERVP
jgi:hypothetical protein